MDATNSSLFCINKNTSAINQEYLFAIWFLSYDKIWEPTSVNSTFKILLDTISLSSFLLTLHNFSDLDYSKSLLSAFGVCPLLQLTLHRAHMSFLSKT